MTRVAFAGDWHGNTEWAVERISELEGITDTILHVGDFWPATDYDEFTEAVNNANVSNSIKKIMVTLGNHEPWDRFRNIGPEPFQVAETIFVLPRPYRFVINNTSFLSLGGAHSVDFDRDDKNFLWFSDEAITDKLVEETIKGGYADILITHESPEDSPIKAVKEILRSNPRGWTDEALKYSLESRIKISEVWDSVRPKLLIHGHMHVPGQAYALDGRKIVSLGRDGQDMNTFLLDV